MAGTNVPSITWTSTGVVVPTQAAILAGVQADFQAAFGGNMNAALNTPQGQLASSLAAIIANCYATIAYFANNVNPNAATDAMQDAIAYIYYLTRNPGTPTSVQCTCTGVAGTVIPVGAQATDTSGNLYEASQSATIGSGGTATVTFENVTNGPIACPTGTLTQIYKAIAGWNAITNPSPGVLGTDVESQAAFAARMQASVAVNAQGSLQAIYGAVASLAGVSSVYVYENDTNSAVNVGSTNYQLLANSIYVAAVGGAAASIAQAIFSKKSPGCATNGNTSVTVYDTSYPQGQQPSYTIKYNVPTSIPISAVVTIKNSSNLPSNYATLIQNALLAAFDNGVAAVTNSAGTIVVPAVPAISIASNIVAANYFAPVLAAFQPMTLFSILLGTVFSGSGSVASSTTLTITGTPTGFLAPGDYVTGISQIPANTYIVSQLSGTTGGAGTYQMSQSATGSGSGTVTSATGNLQSYQAGIDQIPTLAAANISVVTS
jgi:uncharacterized phage protein gp47/JayE